MRSVPRATFYTTGMEQGSGNAALAAARRWCVVTAVDWVAALLERGRERAAAERVQITFQEGEAENLPFAAASRAALICPRTDSTPSSRTL
jgi:ubiquinone/menaquinone biosynthesis C-methylase UbiE